MKNIEFSVNKKIGRGKISYKILLNNDGTFKIAILENPDGGSCKKGPLSLDEARELVNGKSGDNNNKAFWDVILKDLGLS